MPLQTAWIGLGANLGDALDTLHQACRELATAPGIANCEISGFYRTVPIDSDGPLYINAVAQVSTTLQPLALLDLLQSIENRHGRERPYRNAPRTLDLDLLLYGDTVLETPRLTLPHPRMHERAFVLQPLMALAPDMQLAQGSVRELLARCGDQGVTPL